MDRGLSHGRKCARARVCVCACVCDALGKKRSECAKREPRQVCLARRERLGKGARAIVTDPIPLELNHAERPVPLAEELRDDHELSVGDEA